jgi:hypothetical protein
MTPLIWAQKAPVPTGGGGGGSGNIIARFRSRPVLPATATDSLSVAFRNRSWGPITSLRLGLGDSLERLYRLSLRRSKGG